MKYIKIAFWGCVAICLILVAMANRKIVELRAMPDWLSEALGLAPTIQMPLYLAIFAGVALGLVIGLIWEWLREHKHRVAMRKSDREARKLEREVKRLRNEKHEGKDEVLAILENATAKP